MESGHHHSFKADMRNLGTSSLVVAAFVGPGTVLTCAAAGVRFSYSLGWVMLFATVAVFVLQTFTAASGILARKGLGEAIRDVTKGKWYRIPLFATVVLGLWIGSAAFETGNLAGAAAGIDVLFTSSVDPRWWSALCALIAGLILLGDLVVVRRVLTVLVAAMSVLFVGSAMLTPVNWSSILSGMTTPSVPDDSLLTIIALIGTTVVTYNLFLHASATKHYWTGISRQEGWKRERVGMLVFLPLGGLISLAIMITGASLAESGTEVTQIQEFVLMLKPVAGDAAGILFGLGLFAAGITSAITAPLAVAGGVSELFGWSLESRQPRYSMLWSSVLLAGLLFSMSGYSPLELIIAAQAANGLLLPVLAGILVYATARQQEIQLSRVYLAAGILIILFCGALGLRTLGWVWAQLT